MGLTPRPPARTAIPIDRPAMSATGGLSADQRALYETLSAMLAGDVDWKRRRLTFLAILQRFRDAFEGDTAAEAGCDDDGHLPFMAIMPVHIGVLLEKLAETEMSSVEQAAFYLLSIHPEHQVAADLWLQADRGRQRAFAKFIDTNPYYGALYEQYEKYTAEPDD